MVGLEGAFPFIAFMDVTIVVSPSNVEFAEQLYSLEVFNALSKIGEQGDIFLGDSLWMQQLLNLSRQNTWNSGFYHLKLRCFHTIQYFDHVLLQLFYILTTEIKVFPHHSVCKTTEFQ